MHEKCNGRAHPRKRILPTLVRCLPASLWLFAAAAPAEDIVPYRLTGMEGQATLRYAGDSASSGQSFGAAPFRQSQGGFRTELFVMTHSYVYHPNLLTLDIGGGPILHNDSIQSGGNALSGPDTTTSRGALYNFTARANLLRDKPYRGTLFFEHLNPTVSVAPGQVMMQENTRYGGDVALSGPLLPVAAQAGFSHAETKGRGSDRQIDNSVDQFTFGARRSFGALGSSNLQWQSTRQTSVSGSDLLPIQASSGQSDSALLDTRLQFGSRGQYDFTNQLSVNAQTYALGATPLPDYRDVRGVFDLRARHSERVQTHGAYSIDHSTQGELDVTGQSASAGVNVWPMTGMEAAAGVHADSSDTRQFQSRVNGWDGSARYQHELPVGLVQASYGVRQDARSQQSASAQTPVLGESAALPAIGYAVLGHQRVLAGSLVVSNAARTQVFTQGIDYQVVVVGQDTRLQRLAGGAILEGEQVLVDYSYDTGGTYAYEQLDQTFNLNWGVSRFVNVYYRRNASSPRLTSGLPTAPLNTIAGRTIGVRADVPLRLGVAMTVGGGLEREMREETIAPFRRGSDELYVQTDEPPFDLGFFRATRRHSRTDYAAATQNSAIVSTELRYWSRQWFGIDLTAAMSNEREAGGLLARRRSERSLGLQWQERQLTVTGSYVRVLETQGDFLRTRSSFQLLARRAF